MQLACHSQSLYNIHRMKANRLLLCAVLLSNVQVAYSPVAPMKTIGNAKGTLFSMMSILLVGVMSLGVCSMSAPEVLQAEEKAAEQNNTPGCSMLELFGLNTNKVAKLTAALKETQEEVLEELDQIQIKAKAEDAKLVKPMTEALRKDFKYIDSITRDSIVDEAQKAWGKDTFTLFKYAQEFQRAQAREDQDKIKTILLRSSIPLIIENFLDKPAVKTFLDQPKKLAIDIKTIMLAEGAAMAASVLKKTRGEVLTKEKAAAGARSSAESRRADCFSVLDPLDRSPLDDSTRGEVLTKEKAAAGARSSAESRGADYFSVLDPLDRSLLDDSY